MDRNWVLLVRRLIWPHASQKTQLRPQAVPYWASILFAMVGTGRQWAKIMGKSLVLIHSHGAYDIVAAPILAWNQSGLLPPSLARPSMRQCVPLNSAKRLSNFSNIELFYYPAFVKSMPIESQHMKHPAPNGLIAIGTVGLGADAINHPVSICLKVSTGNRFPVDWRTDQKRPKVGQISRTG